MKCGLPLSAAVRKKEREIAKTPARLVCARGNHWHWHGETREPGFGIPKREDDENSDRGERGGEREAHSDRMERDKNLIGKRRNDDEAKMASCPGQIRQRWEINRDHQSAGKER